MKKFLTISFVTLYAILSIGMNVVVHTCSGESEALIATSKIKDPCVCNEEMPSNIQEILASTGMCCTIELKTVQIDDVQTLTPVNIQQNRDVVDFLPSIEISTFVIDNSKFVIPLDTSPPPNKNFQISNSVFLI